MFDQVSCRYVRASTRSQRESIPDGEIDKAAPRLARHAVHWQMRRKPVKEMAIVRNKSFVDRPSRACFSFGPFFFTRLRAESRFLGFDARSRGWLSLKIKQSMACLPGGRAVHAAVRGVVGNDQDPLAGMLTMFGVGQSYMAGLEMPTT
ncbi:hypothetical protein H0G86_003440 [Trichoderma simmonsii]|uniref:Uncharacterized protein n=1 Tax=Trichoderma simmonsii TaxID=1491479 RepID=A0A8G0PEF0_9HYPO|nr:hypothetical protein H0G86_003440 [Trichoderma simmonsii]